VFLHTVQLAPLAAFSVPEPCRDVIVNTNTMLLAILYVDLGCLGACFIFLSVYLTPVHSLQTPKHFMCFSTPNHHRCGHYKVSLFYNLRCQYWLDAHVVSVAGDTAEYRSDAVILG